MKSITRAQLVELAKELGVEYKDYTSDEIKENVDNYIKNVIKKRMFYSADNMSQNLKWYLYSFHNVVFEDKNGNKYDHLGNLIKPKRKRKNK